MTGEPAATEIAESDATGSVAALFADIREVTGRPVVNLLLRTLAAQPDALQWSWRLLRPAYKLGSLDDAGEALELESLSVEPLDQTMLTAAGVDDEALPVIHTILTHYNAGNRSTIVALALLRHALDRPIQVTVPVTKEAGKRSSAYQLPPLLQVDAMAKDLRKLVIDLSGRLSGDRAVIVPGIYRHLAHWPGFMALIAARLEPLFEDGAVARRIASVQRQAAERGNALIAPATGDTAPPQEICNAVSVITAEFRHKVAEMLVIGLLIKAALPPDTP